MPWEKDDGTLCPPRNAAAMSWQSTQLTPIDEERATASTRSLITGQPRNCYSPCARIDSTASSWNVHLGQ
jgi:hypothetical protein